MLPASPLFLPCSDFFATRFTTPTPLATIRKYNRLVFPTLQYPKTRFQTAFQIMTDVAAVVAAAAGSRGIGVKGDLVSSSVDGARDTCFVLIGALQLHRLPYRLPNPLILLRINTSEYLPSSSSPYLRHLTYHMYSHSHAPTYNHSHGVYPGT